MSANIQDFSSSALCNLTAGHEGSPLLDARHRRSGGSSLYSSSSVLAYEKYHFDLKREKLRCKKLFCNRIPRGKAPLVVFLINFLESFAFFGALSLLGITLSIGENYVVFTIFQFTVGRVFYPIAGLLADVYLGRYRVIHAGLWLYWIGFAITIMSMTLQEPLRTLSSYCYNVPLYLAIIFFMLGSACVQSTIIPFGVDQIQQGASSDELSSYFSWYYFGHNLGYIANILFTLGAGYIYAPLARKIGIPPAGTNTTNVISDTITSVPGLLALVAITCALLIHICLQHWYFKARQRNNPLKLIWNVVCFAARVKRQMPHYRRSFRYGEGKKPRIELAKIEFDGIYTSEEVEDVKTFFRVLFLILSLGLAFISYGALNNIYSVKLNEESQSAIFPDTKHETTVSFDFFSIIEISLVLIFVLVLNHLIIPCLPGASMKRRIGTGVVFYLLSSAFGAFIFWKLSSIHGESAKLLWLILPTTLFAAGEVLITVSGLEFIYAQSPDSMKGLLTGLFYFIFGVFYAVGTAIFNKFSNFFVHHPWMLMWFFLTVLVIVGVGVVVYIMAACCYRNRERPTNDESENDLIHRSYAASVYSSSY